MRYCRFQTGAGPQYGEVADRSGEPWVERLLPPFEEDAWTRLSGHFFEPVPLESVRLLAPVVPRKIVCIGRNYKDHAAELGNDVPKEPLLFLKPSSSIIGPGDAIRIPAISQRVDFEGEIAIVIGRKTSRIGPDEDVRRYIRGYTIVNDVTARDLQKSDGQWSRAKGFDTFCPAGPIVSDEIDLLGEGAAIETRLNGEVKQSGHTRDLIFPVDRLLRHISQGMTLEPGDLLPTGTPAGVSPMKPGDVVEITVQGIGRLANPLTAGG